VAAIQEFVLAGGGLFVIGDDEPDIYTSLTSFAGITWGWEGGCGGYTSNIRPHPVTEGVTTAYFSMPISNLYVSGQAQSLIRDYCGYVMLAASETGAGKVVAIADEQSIDDSNIGEVDNLRLAVNIIEWITFRPEHDLAVFLDIPTYTEPGEPSLLNLTVNNRGTSNELNVTLFLFINGSNVEEITIPELESGASYKLSYLWTPTVEAIYNVTGYVLPVDNETTLENNFAQAYVFVGYPVKAFVLHSAGNYYSNIIVNWETLNRKWYMFGDQLVYIDYTTLNIDDITYEDIAATEADVLIISCAADPYMGWEFTDVEIEAITRYVMEGHGLIATAGTFYYNVPNNNKLAPVFGLNESIMWSATETDLLYLLNTSHPLFDNVPNPLVFPQVGTAMPYDGQWDLNELVNGEYLALGHYRESAVVARRGLVYISPFLEWIPPHYHHHLQLIYNAIVWSRYQKPKHELTVSLEAPDYLEPGDSVLLNAIVYNGGLSNETNVELQLLINGSLAKSILIPELATGESRNINYTWTPTTEALYNITVYAPPVPNEDDETNNILAKMVRVRSIIGLVVFEEAHLPGYSIGSNPAAYGTGGYSEFANYLRINGYIVSTINPGTIINSSVLASADVLVIVAPQYSYLESELDAIENWVKGGGNLLLISDWGPFGVQARSIASRFNIILRGDAIGDSDENVGDLSQVYYDGANLLVHPVTHGVDRVEIYAGDGILTAPAGEIPLIVTDYDGTAFWFSDNSPAIGVSVMSAFEGGVIGSGRLIIMTDSNIWDSINDVDYDGDVGFYDSDNEVLAINSIDWLSIRYEHDIATYVEAPKHLKPGESVLLNATVYNGGLSNETNVELQLLINGSLAKSILIPELATGDNYSFSHLWKPLIEAIYNITAYAVPVPSEDYTLNNLYSRHVVVSYAIKILAYVQYTDYYQEYANALKAIESTFGSNYILTELWDYTQLDSMLQGNDVLFIPEQEYADFYTMEIVGATWSATLSNFISNGGVLILCDYTGGTYGILTGAGLMSIFGINYITGLTVYLVDPSDPLADGVSSMFTAPDGALSFITGETNVVFNDGTYPVVIHKMIGLGHIALIGFDYYASNPDADRILGNAVGLWVRLEHDLAVCLDAPHFVEYGKSALLNATVWNRGLSNETNVELQLLINRTIVASELIPELISGDFYTLSYNWTPIVKGLYNITVYAPPKIGENRTVNNVITKFVKVTSVRYVLFDQTHSTDHISYYSIWIANLTERGFIIETHTSGPITPEVLEGFDALVIPQARDYYTSDEVAAIQEFVLAGGGLFVIGDDEPDIYTSLTSFAGITWGYGGHPGYTSNITPHPVTEGVTTAYFNSPLSDLYVSRSAQDLIRDVYGDILLAASEIEGGKVVAIADEHSINDYYIGKVDNLRLAVNIIEWITFHITHDVAVLDVTANPTQVYVGQPVSINVTVANEGEANETFTVEVYYQNATGANSTQTNLESRISLMPMEPHDANAMWIEPSTVYLNWSYPVGYKFNVTFWANSSKETKGWQFWLIYPNAYINATRAGYTAGDKSEFFQNITTLPVSPRFKPNWNATHNRLDFGEAWLMGPYRSPGYGSLCWVEFEVIAIPPPGVEVDIPLDIKWAYNQFEPPKTYLLYADGSRRPLDVYNGLVRFTEQAPPPPPSPPPPPTMPPGMIGQAEVSLQAGENTTLTFTWNTTGVEFGNYTIKAIALPVPREQDTEDNTFIDGIVEVLWEHDVAILNIVPSRPWTYIGKTVNLTITAANKGDYIENVTVTLFYNFTAGKQIGTVQFENLAPNENRTLLIVWNTTGVEPSRNYTITAIAEIEKPDSNPSDNIFTDAKVQIRWLGDINGDFYVGIDDVLAAAEAFGEDPTRPRWNPDADLNGDNYIGIDDIALIADNFGSHY
jgi:subtilase family serine protease